MKQQGLCHPKYSKCVQNKQSDWSDFIGWSKQAIWLVQLLTLWRGFEKYLHLRVTKVPFLKSCLWFISFMSDLDHRFHAHRVCVAWRRNVRLSAAIVVSPFNVFRIYVACQNMSARYTLYRDGDQKMPAPTFDPQFDGYRLEVLRFHFFVDPDPEPES